MNRMKSIACALILLATSSAIAQQRSGEFFVTQSWSQEKDFKRLYVVRVPEHKTGQKLPVFIFLHGNGGNAKDASGFARRNRKIASRYITVFADGYRESLSLIHI